MSCLLRKSSVLFATVHLGLFQALKLLEAPQNLLNSRILDAPCKIATKINFLPSHWQILAEPPLPSLPQCFIMFPYTGKHICWLCYIHLYHYIYIYIYIYIIISLYHYIYIYIPAFSQWPGASVWTCPNSATGGAWQAAALTAWRLSAWCCAPRRPFCVRHGMGPRRPGVETHGLPWEFPHKKWRFESEKHRNIWEMIGNPPTK